MSRVFIVGGGVSLHDFPFQLLKNEEVIVVNKAILAVPEAKYFVTMDFSFFRKVNVQHVIQAKMTKVFVANFAKSYLKEVDGRIVDMRFKLVYDLSVFDMIIKSRIESCMGFEFKDFRTGCNSGFCALQLAVLLGYTHIYLLGYDLVASRGLTHYHGGYGEAIASFSGKLIGYFDAFREGLATLKITRPDIYVGSGSNVSALNSILPYVDVVALLRKEKECLKQK